MQLSPGGVITADMSHDVTLWCGCLVYVSCHPETGVAHTRVVERRGGECPMRNHEVGAHLWLWEMLPDAAAQRPMSPDPRRLRRDGGR